MKKKVKSHKESCTTFNDHNCQVDVKCFIKDSVPMVKITIDDVDDESITLSMNGEASLFL